MLIITPCFNRIWKKEKDHKVSVFKKEIICAVHFNNDKGISIGTVVKDVKKNITGIVIELDDGSVMEDFITIWWPDGDEYGKRHTFDQLENGEISIVR